MPPSPRRTHTHRYLDGTGDTRVVKLFEKVWNSSYEMDKSADARSLTQAEAMLEG
eukprot:COSAG05_NODE_1023_length_6126_cov_6.196117_7_plen_55_part_00